LTDYLIAFGAIERGCSARGLRRRRGPPVFSIVQVRANESEAMKRKLIIGYQDTPQGYDALALGEVLAETLNARPLAATVPLIATVLPWSRQLMSESDLEAALYLETKEPFAAVRDRLAALEPETRAIANHSPSAALYELASEEGAALIVVGSTHRGRLGRVLPGSVGQALLHGAPCAVAVAPRGYAARDTRRLQRLAVAFDGSAESWAAFETAVNLAARLHATLTVITVAEPEAYGYATAASILTAAEFHNFEHEEKQRVLDLAMGRVPADLPVEGRLLTGSPGRLLAEASQEFDLMLTGSRGYGALKRTALGSVAGRLVNSAACPVLVLPRGVGMDPLGLDIDKARAVGAR
jgi:nucleotide-binding universal stress UspA family protein